LVFSVAVDGHSWKQILVGSWQAALGKIDAIGDVDEAVENRVSI
jgi:hypothetical protein